MLKGKNDILFARIMGFDRIEYASGAFYNRRSHELEEGFQIDLMDVRADHKPGAVYRDLERKKNLISKSASRFKNYTFEYALITTEGTKNKLKENEYFDHVITFDEIFDTRF